MGSTIPTRSTPPLTRKAPASASCPAASLPLVAASRFTRNHEVQCSEGWVSAATLLAPITQSLTVYESAFSLIIRQRRAGIILCTAPWQPRGLYRSHTAPSTRPSTSLRNDGGRRGRATTYSEGYKRANHTAGGIGMGKCKVGNAISLLCANGPLPYRG